jgi:hypothetical protein
MIYDVNIDHEVIKILKEEENNLFYKSGRNNEIWGLGLHLISLDKLKLIEFINLINKEDYLSDTSDDVFNFIVKKNKQLGMIVSDVVIFDEIYLFEEENVWGKKLNENIRYFIHRTEEDNFVKLIFYGFEGELQIQIQYNNFLKISSVKEYDEIEISEKNFHYLCVRIKNFDYDITDVVNSVKNNFYKIDCKE